MKWIIILLLTAASVTLQAPIEGHTSTYPSSATRSSIQTTLPTADSTQIYAKTNVSDCAVEGSPGVNSTSKFFGPQNVSDVLGCQKQCFYAGGCVMYSWTPSASPDTRCLMYAAVGSLDEQATLFTAPVVKGKTGVFWSDKTPRDGSSFCYSTTPIPSKVLQARTTSQPTPSGTTSPDAITTKTNLPHCHYQGLPGNITNYFISTSYAFSPLTCQNNCIATQRCLSYSHQPAPATNTADNCNLFGIAFETVVNGTPLVVSSIVDGIYYSDRYPGDGTDYCYSAIKPEPPAPQTKNQTTLLKTANPTGTTTSIPVIETKALKSCNVEGMPTTLLDTYTLNSLPERTVLGCQSACNALSTCLSYSYQPVPSTNAAFPNCELFSTKWNTKVNGTDVVISGSRFGIYYSDKYPGDGTDFCFYESGGASSTMSPAAETVVTVIQTGTVAGSTSTSVSNCAMYGYEYGYGGCPIHYPVAF